MKSFLKFLPIAAAVLLATSCSKDDNDNAPATESGRDCVHTVSTTGIPFTIRVNTGRSLKKVGYAESTKEGEKGWYNITFSNEDVSNQLKMIIKEGETQIGEATLQSDKATFSGSLTQQPSSNATLTAEISVSGSKNSSDESLAALLATCAHTFSGTFTYGAAEVDLTDQTSYLAITLPSDETTVNVNGNECALKDGKVWVAFNSSEKVHSARLSLFNKQADPGTIYTVTRGASTFNGNAEFSVSPSKKVKFSPGNLLYQASSKKWEFAARQWDYVGYADGNTTAENRANNVAYIDLFGWGTGDNPTLASNAPADYATFSNWGDKIKDGNEWQTLTADEWYYLIHSRENASEKYGVAEVAGVQGLILLPDGWKLPEGLSFKSGLTAFDVRGQEYYKTINNYSAEEWRKMESAGAVFLPAAGYRLGTSVDVVGDYGWYWTSSFEIFDDAVARKLYFGSFMADATYGCGRFCGCSVRLVRAAQ